MNNSLTIIASNIEAYTSQIEEAIKDGWEVQYGHKAPMQVGFSFTAWLEKPSDEDISVVKKPGRPPKQ